MAIIQKIRDKYAKVAGGVIAVSLIAFVLNDAFNSNSGSIFGNNTALAKVDGDAIDPMDFDRLVRAYNTVYTISNPNKPITDDIRAQIEDQSLRDLVNEKVIDRQLKKLGIVISEKEMKDMIYGNNPSPMVMQYPAFTNPETGAFDASRVKGYQDQLDNPPADADPQLIEKEREQWENFKIFAQHQYKLQKFNGLIAAGLYTPKFLVDQKMAAQNEMASLIAVKVPTTIIPDAEVALTDADINAYVEKHKKRFAIKEEIRGIDYVAFDVVPSKEDTNAAASSMDKLKAELLATPSADLENFVTKNSEQGYRRYYFTKNNFKSVYADTIFSQPDGGVVGPYIEGSNFMLARVVDRKTMPDTVKAAHILIQPTAQMNDSAAHKTADSLLAAIRAGADFDTLARQFSADKQNSEMGGDLGYFPYGAMVPEFNDYVFENPVGDMKVIKTNYGYHIVKIKEQKNPQPAYRLAFVVKSLFPSEATETALYAQATEFAGKYKNDFEGGVKAMNLQKREADNVRVQDFSVQGVGPAREVVRWMYDAKEKEVSEVLNVTFPVKRYIIAKLTNIQTKGTLKVNDAVKPELESIVRNEKKMDKIVEKFKTQSSLEAIAQAAGQPIIREDSFTATVPYLPNLGYEPKAVGYAFYKNAKVGAMAPPIKGQDAVTFMQITMRAPKQVNPNEAMVFQQQMQMEQQRTRQMIGNQFQEMMLRKAKVKYYNDNIR